MIKSYFEWVKVETATLLLLFEEMYVAEMTVHAKYIFINMHEYLAPLSPCNMGLIFCNVACKLLIGSICLFLPLLKTPAVHQLFPPSSLGAAQTHRSQYVFLRPKCKCIVIKERLLHVQCVRRWVFLSPLPF